MRLTSLFRLGCPADETGARVLLPHYFIIPNVGLALPARSAMRLLLRLSKSCKSVARPVAVLVASAVALGLAGCSNTTEPGPDRGLDYYPAKVENFWVFAVTDSAWTPATAGQPSTLQVTSYQFRETLTDEFVDAAGQKVLRLVRARRPTPTAPWVNDSVFSLSATPQSVVLNRSNLRTLELIFPVREDRLWRFNAYNNNSNDTIDRVVAETRQYRQVGQPFTTRQGATLQTYPVTLTTTNEGPAKENDAFRVKTYRQVFAKGVGPVFRQRRQFENFYTTAGSSGNVVFVPGSYFYGFSRTETLVDYGPR